MSGKLLSEVRDILKKVNVSPISIHKSGLGTQCLLAHSVLQKGQNVVIVVPDEHKKEEFQEILHLFAGDQSELPLWKRQWIDFPAFHPKVNSVALWAKRWAALFGLSLGQKPRGVLLTLDNLLPLWPSPEEVEDEFLFITNGEEISPELIAEKATQWGFERVSMVTRLGEIAVRGGILDIFPPGYSFPLRCEFFGDTLESIRQFTPLTQRSRQNLDQIVILPVVSVILDEDKLSKARNLWNHLWKTGSLSKQMISALEQRLDAFDMSLLPGIFYPQSVPLSRWLDKEAIYFLVGADKIRARLEELEGEWEKYLEEEAINDTVLPQNVVMQTVTSARQTWLDKAQILFEELPLGERGPGKTLPEQRYASFHELFWKPEQRTHPWSTLISSLKEWKQVSHQILLSFHNEHSRSRFLRLLQDEDLDLHQEYHSNRHGVFALISHFSAGLELKWNQTFILSENVLQPQKNKTASQLTGKNDFKGLKRLDDIQTGDLLVHRDYGIGRFLELTRLQVDRTGNDYLLLEYAGNDKLYVPVDKLSLVQRYKGPDGAVPSLDKLGSIQWNKTKDRVRKAIETIAYDLVEMYAYRKLAKGYVYSVADELYREFEATFDFNETVDQEQAIQEVLNDMDKPEPMDRLVCGDAGFGKTEVAMRAAFRAVLAGKQVALLCPTTVLAEQHFRNFQRRMADFSVNVAMVSRFVSAAEQKRILQSAERGAIDILIGTHRLLSDDVRLPKLSLFILDEEQRFGVRHKEKLKKMRKNIDVLTLSATPIPRTLQLSLSGLRQLSVIETPPQERKAVETSLIERNPKELREIIEREMIRQGQVFWVFNRVKGITGVKDFVQALVPGARVAIAHGQMAERKLEQTMLQFWHGEIDILICTAIIESGLDFPRANTLVVDQAQMFGLGQLYQLRGRVGRSKEQAYSYFVVPSLDNLSQSAEKRLKTILDMDYLGAGFQVAMEDLRLRGAGNILGEVQSGNMSKVGLDLFLDMLQQEVQKVRGLPLKEETEPELNIAFEANIPGNYIADPQERLSYYKGMSSASSEEQLSGWAEELKDRFGPLPEEVKNLLSVFDFKRQASQLRVEKVDLFSNRVVLVWGDQKPPFEPEQLVRWMEHLFDRVHFTSPSKLELRFSDNGSISKELHGAIQELKHLQQIETPAPVTELKDEEMD